MVKPMVVEDTNTAIDPTPAEAAQIASKKSRKARKTADGATGPSNKPLLQPPNATEPTTSPIRPAGSKRRQQLSPQSSPQRTAALSEVNEAGGVPDQSLTPLKLKEKLELLGGLKDLTPYQATQIVGDKDWKGEMIFHKDIELLLQGPDSPLDWATSYAFEHGESGQDQGGAGQESVDVQEA
jgi:hypothetical protein